MKKLFKNHIVLIFIFLISLASRSNAQNQAQFDILEQLYLNALGNSWSNNTGWLNSGIPVCDWYGVTCNGSGEIIEIDLSNNNLAGTLPVQITNLHKLKVLDVSGNQLSDAVAASYFQSFTPNIEVIDFSNNEIGFYDVSSAFIDLNCNQGILNMQGNDCFCPNLTDAEICQGFSCEYLDISITSGPTMIGQNVDLLATGGANYVWDNGQTGPTATYFVNDYSLIAEVNSTFNGCQDTEIIRIKPEFELATTVPKQKEVLLAFYTLNNGPQWANELAGIDPWFLTDDFCSWFGIECDNDIVKRISLPNNSINADIYDISVLRFISSLQAVDLSGNNYTGCYNVQMCNLPFDLDLSYNCQLPYEGNLEYRCEFPFSKENCESFPGILYEYEACTNNVICSFPGGYDITWFNGETTEEIALTINSTTVVSVTTACGDVYSITLEPQIITTQLNDLVSLYNMTNGTEWVNKEGPLGIAWLEGCNVCDWYGISCNSNNDVIGIDLSNNGLQGVLDESWFENLTELDTLNLSNNDLSGSIELDFSSTSLSYLDLSINNFTGTYPLNMDQMDIDFLDLSSNNLTGEVNFLDFAAGMLYFDLSDNNYFGELDPALASLNFNQLTYLNLTNNDFEGCYPSSFSNLCYLNDGLLPFGGNDCLWLEGDFTAWCNDMNCNFFVFDGDQDICIGEPTDISVSGPQSVEWSTGETSFEIEVSPLVTTTYYVTDQCDRVDSVTVEVNPVYSLFYTDTICAYEVSVFGGIEYNETGVYEQLYSSIDGCDSLETLDLFVYPLTPDETVFEEICDNESMIFEGTEYEEAGVYPVVVQDVNGCDYIRTLDLTVIALPDLMISEDICWNESYVYNGITYDASGVYFDTIPDVLGGCDTAVVIQINQWMQTPDETVFEEICDNESIIFEGTEYEEAGVYPVVVQDVNGCDYIFTLDLTVIALPDLTISEDICWNESYVYNGITYDASGVYFDTIPDVLGGCDTAVVIQINQWMQTPDETVFELICDNESIVFEGGKYDVAGVYPVVVQDVNGCDFVRTLDLTVIALPDLTISEDICWNESYVYNGVVYDASGVYFDTIPDVLGGCDTAVVIQINQWMQTPDETVFEEICDNESIIFEGTEYEEAGVYPVVVQDVNGCDYIRTLDLTVIALPDLTISEDICWNASYVYDGITYDASGVYFDTIPDVLGGCDTAVVIQINQWMQTPDETVFELICNNESIVFEGGEYDVAGVYPVVVQDVNGCDFVRTLDLTVIALPDLTISEDICWNENYVYNGIVYDASGVYFDTIPDVLGGCDIAVVIQINQWMQTPDETVFEVICDNESIIFEGTEYEEAGVYPVVVQDVNGCDYIRTLDLGVSPNPSIVNTYLLCPGDSVVVGSSVYYDSGNFIDTLANAPLCDSIIFSNITLLSADFISIDSTICEGDTLFGFYETGQYQFEVDQGVCFTIFDLTLTVEEIPTASFSINLCEGSEVEFLGEVYTESGIFEYSVETGFVCDSVYIIEVIGVPVDTIMLFETICSNEPFMGYTETGIYTYEIDEGALCPTFYILDLLVEDLIPLVVNDSICEGDQVEYYGTIYDAEGMYFDTVQSVNSCDTAFSLNLAYYPIPPDVQQEASICVGDSISFYGQYYSEAGSYSVNTFDNNGCAFQATLLLTVDEIVMESYYEEICWNETVVIRGVEYSSSVVIEELIPAFDDACDTLVQIEVNQFEQTADEFLEVQICANESYVFQGMEYNEAGSYNVSLLDINNCMYTSTLILGVDPNPVREESIIICEGESYAVGDSVYSATGVYESYIENSACDSLIITDLTVIQMGFLEIDSTICEGDEAYGYTESGNYVFELSSGDCSVEVQLDLTVEAIPVLTFDETICLGDSVEIRGVYYSSSYSNEEFITGELCDTFLSINVLQLGSYVSVDTVICSGESIYGINESGEYEIEEPLTGGCFNVVSLTLEVEELGVNVQVDSICSGDSILWNGAYVSETGVYEFTSSVDDGCDSIYVLELTSVTDIPSLIDTTICAGESFLGVSVTDTFTHVSSIGECSVDVLVYLQVQSAVSSEQAIGICSGDTLYVGNVPLTTTGIHEVILSNEMGCDSLVKTFLTVNVVDTLIESIMICDGEEYQGFQTSGSYTYSQNSGGLCDDIIFLELTVLPSEMSSDILYLCPGDSVLINGIYETMAGQYQDSLQAQNGCDSIVFIDLIDVEMAVVSIDTTICEGQDFEGFDSTGVYQYEIQLADDCIVEVELDLTVLEQASSYDLIELCEGDFIEIEGEVIEVDSVVTVFYNGSNGCDSVAVFDVQFMESLLVELDTVICAGDSLFNFSESGTYDFSITQGNCVLNYMLELEVVDTIYVDSLVVIASSCGGEDGSVDVDFSSEIQGGLYSIDGGASYQDSSIFDGLVAGMYEIQAVFPGFTCLDALTYSFEIEGIEELLIDTINYVSQLCDGELGGITLGVLNGEGPYVWLWEDGSIDSVRTELGEGNYSVSVEDVNGCSAVVELEVIAGEVLISDYSGAVEFSICYGDTIILEADNADLIHEWYYEGELIGEGIEVEATEVGQYMLISSDGESCDGIAEIEILHEGIDFSGVDFLIPLEGVMGTPIASVDVTIPDVDSTYYEYDVMRVMVIQELENRTVFLFSEPGIHEISFITEIDGCAKKLTKEINIVSTVEELAFPELYQAFSGSIIDFGLYPNPNDGIFKAVISMSAIQGIEVLIFDVNGNIIVEESHGDQVLYDLDFDISDLPAGPYSFFVTAGVDWKYIGFIKD